MTTRQSVGSVAAVKWGQFAAIKWGQFAAIKWGQFGAVKWGLFQRNFHISDTKND
jgi:hypothetical protein